MLEYVVWSFKEEKLREKYLGVLILKICFVAPANNYHTKKWCKWFSDNGHEVHVISFINENIDNVKVHFIDTGASATSNDSQKLKYLTKFRDIRRIIKQINPDIVNAHYASSYGAAMALTGIKGYILSLWGSDVFDFPRRSWFHKILFKYSLKKCGHIFSTSQYMADEAHKYTNKEIYITPFGVDMELFNPSKRTRAPSDASEFIIGTVKKLEPVYGIDILLEAVSLVIKAKPDINIKVRIAGNGTHENEYKSLANKLGLDSVVSWLGFISQEEAAKEWANMDLAVIPSRNESFGVSAIEAQASETPVIISNIDGLKETTIPCKTSIVLNKNTSEDLSKTIIYVYNNWNKYADYGSAGREFICNNYEINTCFKKIEELYNIFLK